MAVVAREAWTDERLDDLNREVDEGFKEMRAEFAVVRSEMRAEFKVLRSEMGTEFKAVRDEMREELRWVRSEIGALNRTVIQFAYAVVGTIFLGFMGTIAALITLV